MIFNRHTMTALLVIFVIFAMMIPVVANTNANETTTTEETVSVLLYNLEHDDSMVYKSVQTSDYTFIVNAILLIIASVTFILVRIKRRDKNQK